jgi:hypothetical protein
MAEEIRSRQLLHFVSGGALERLDDVVFKHVGNLDIVGMYPSYATAYAACKAEAQQTVDDAQTRSCIAHLHRLRDPGASAPVSTL